MTIDGGKVKTAGIENSTHTLYAAPFFNNNVLSRENLWIYTNVGTLHTGTLKVNFQCVKQYTGIS